MASRRKARILAFQALYAWDASSIPVGELLAFDWLEEAKLAALDDESRAFSTLIISGTIEKVEKVDAAIRSHLEHWSFERIKKVDLAILRVSAYSLMFQRDMPARIVIDEAIEIAKEFGSEDSYKFINGVLDALWKSEQAAE